MEIGKKIVEQAYKKLKLSVYFDKTQLILRNAIVEFEKSCTDIDGYLKTVYDSLFDDNRFAELREKILSSVKVNSFPKKIDNDDRSKIISNSVPKKNTVKEMQHFINMSVEGHILGVLWIMLIGYKMDKGIYEHSYGNRIRKRLINELSDKPTYSPYLFEPYFAQYESWRDKAISEAQAHLRLKQDVVIITMDFRRYYYSVDANRDVFDGIFKTICEDSGEYSKPQMKVLKRLNDFAYAVVDKYAALFGGEFDGKHILPIGFLPSNILGNWCLKNFDKAIIDGWNPVYYGRYVDDILIVDKVEHNSDIYLKARDDALTNDEIINYFLKRGSDRGSDRDADESRDSTGNSALLEEDEEETEKASKKAGKKVTVYRVNHKYNVINGNASNIIVHNDKVKIFYFKSGESEALLTSFKNHIARNKSEFRHLPEDEAVFRFDDYTEIYQLKNSETINKFRGVENIRIDRFELSKFLGKYLRIVGMTETVTDSGFERDILKIFNYRALIENYTTWEKVIEVFVIDERFDTIERFVSQIIDAIEQISVCDDSGKYNDNYTKNVKNSLYLHLHSVLSRTFALVWKNERDSARKKIYSIPSFAKAVFSGRAELKDGEREEYLNGFQMAYCRTCMIDKSVLPVNIFLLPLDDIRKKKLRINLTSFVEVLQNASDKWETKYKYFPYIVNMYDLSMISCIEELKRGSKPFGDQEDIHKRLNERYNRANYNLAPGSHYRSRIERLTSVRRMEKMPISSYLISIGDGDKTRLRLAAANVKSSRQSLRRLVMDKPDRSYSRYCDLAVIVNQAIDQRADMLVMPESYVPFEWLSTLARTCAGNGLAVVTGVEHIKYEDKNYDLIAVILPYLEEGHRSAYISFHLKRYYAPSEREELNGYRLKEMTGDHYELYKWNNCYFPVYFGYELTSLSDRALFRAYADLLISLGGNDAEDGRCGDIPAAVGKDVHCYVVQANSSDDSGCRITKPSRTEDTDILRVKGGTNSTILVGDIDIAALREFQLKEPSIQRAGGSVPTPPGFDVDVTLKKIKGEQL